MGDSTVEEDSEAVSSKATTSVVHQEAATVEDHQAATLVGLLEHLEEAGARMEHRGDRRVEVTAIGVDLVVEEEIVVHMEAIGEGLGARRGAGASRFVLHISSLFSLLADFSYRTQGQNGPDSGYGNRGGPPSGPPGPFGGGGEKRPYDSGPPGGGYGDDKRPRY